MREQLEGAIDQDPRNAKNWALLSQVLIAQRDLSSAASSVSMALSLDPNLALALIQKGELALRTGHVVEAEASFQHAAKLWPRCADAHAAFYALDERVQ